MHRTDRQTQMPKCPADVPLPFRYYTPQPDRVPFLPAQTAVEQMYAYYSPETAARAA
ncbi:hypothetical protein [Frigidibacter sp. SD6-1]|uniref:hypothetical protein n=1 Tax=Frigidibacter sp. SD6-1 TaxID=3032581 RepID=UPI0024DFA5DC|nr:hypothetical protein [Frigidibacter sp. SD6-1]